MRPHEYLSDIVDSNLNKICSILIQRSSSDIYTIGQTFLFNLYTVYDYENKRVGFFKHIYSDIDEGDGGVDREPIDPETGSTFPIWAIIVIIAAALVMVVVAAVLFIRRRNRRLAKTLEDYNQLEGTNKGKTSN